MTTYGVVGLYGQGKTLFLAKKAVELRDKGIPVMTNFPVVGCYYSNELEPFMQFAAQRQWQNGKPKPKAIMIDEVNIVFPSRMWEKMPAIVLYVLSQQRKFGCDFYWSSQHEARVDKVVRELTYMIYSCHKFLNFFYGRGYLPEEFRKEKSKPISRFLYRGTQKLYKQFDTYQDVKLPAHIDEKLKPSMEVQEWSIQYALESGTVQYIEQLQTLTEKQTP